jgi:hypothetical protein
MEGFATEVGNAIYGVGVLIEKLKSIPGAGVIKQFVEFGMQTSAIGYLTRFGESEKARKAGNFVQSPGDRKKIEKINADALAIQKRLNGLKKIENDATARKIVLTGDELALKELEKKFDVERIGLYAALNESTDGETKMRLLSLIAIQDQNTAMAGMIKKANEAENAFATLIEALRATVRAMLDKIAPEVKQLQTLTGPSTPIDVQREVIRNKLDLAMPDISALQSRLGQFSNASSSGGTSPTYIINASGIGDQQIASVVQGAIQDLNRYGNSTTYAGAI